MLNKKNIFLSFIGLSSGILTGMILLLLLIKLPFSGKSAIYKTLGIKKPQIIGFQPFWLIPRADKNYNPYLTTYTYFSLTLDSDGTIHKLVNPQEEEPGWTTLRRENFSQKLKQAKEDGLRLSLLIHQSNEENISTLLENPKKNANRLIKDVFPIMRKYGFSDLNLDIESFKDASKKSQKQFITFVKEVKKGLDENNLGTLTIEITPISLVKPRLTDVSKIATISDYIVLMAYDFHYINSYISGPVAPVGGAGKIREYDVEQSIKEAIKVIPAEKIILGIPLYGYEWETLNNYPLSAVIPGSGAVASNRRVIKLLSSCKNCTNITDIYSKQPYVIFPSEDGKFFYQIFYEDKSSLSFKLNLAKKNHLAGIALWALGYEGDDILSPLSDYKQSIDWIPLSL